MNRRVWLYPSIFLASLSSAFAAGEFTEVLSIFGSVIGEIFSGDWIAGHEVGFFRFLLWIALYSYLFNVMKLKVFANLGDGAKKTSMIMALVVVTAITLAIPPYSTKSVLFLIIVLAAVLGLFIALYRPNFMEGHPTGKNLLRLLFLSFTFVVLMQYRSYLSDYVDTFSPLGRGLNFMLTVAVVVAVIAWIMALISMFSEMSSKSVWPTNDDGSLKGITPGSVPDIAAKGGKAAGKGLLGFAKKAASAIGDLFGRIFNSKKRKQLEKAVTDSEKALSEKEKQIADLNEKLSKLSSDLDALKKKITDTPNPSASDLEKEKAKQAEIAATIQKINDTITELEKIADLENNVEKQLNELNFHEVDNARNYMNSCIAKQNELQKLTQATTDPAIKSHLLEFGLKLSPQIQELESAFVNVEKAIRVHAETHEKREQILEQLKHVSSALKKVNKKTDVKEYAELLAQRRLLEKEKAALSIRSINAKLNTAVDTFIHYGGLVYETLSQAGEILGQRIEQPEQGSPQNQTHQQTPPSLPQGYTPTGRFKLIPPDKSFPAFITHPDFLLGKLSHIHAEITKIPLAADPKNQDPNFTNIIRTVSHVLEEFEDNFGKLPALRLASRDILTKSHGRLYDQIQNFNKNIITNPGNLFLLWQDVIKVIRGESPSMITVKGMPKENAQKIAAIFEAEQAHFTEELQKVEHALRYI